MELGAHLMAANQSKEDMKITQANADLCKEKLLTLNERIEANSIKVEDSHLRPSVILK